MTLYHVTTPKKARRYAQSGCIKKPVRGFTNLLSALAWACKVGRTVVYEINADDNVYKLPDHHNKYGEAWWIDKDVTNHICVFSADKDA